MFIDLASVDGVALPFCTKNRIMNSVYAMRFLSNIRSLLIGLWLGAAVFFSFAVAPSAFAVLPTRELAGIIVSRSLLIIHISGLAIALIALLGSYVGSAGVNRVLLWSERILFIIVAIACAVGEFVVARLLSFTKAQMGRPIDEMAVDDPLRVQFNNLHEYSVWILVAAMIAAVIAYFLVAGRKEPVAVTSAKPIDFNFDKEFKI